MSEGTTDAKAYGSRPQKLGVVETIAELERAYQIYGQSSDARQMLEFGDAEKSWVFVGVKVKRLAKTARDRLAYLARQRIRPEFETGSGESSGLKAKEK